MRLIALQICASFTALLFIMAVCSIAAHRARNRCDRAGPISALAEYAWAVIPWAIVVVAALPAARLVVAQQAVAVMDAARDDAGTRAGPAG